MAIRRSSAEWKGGFKDGSGSLKLGSGLLQAPFSYSSRFESGSGTNPEELIGAAHAACFSMYLSALLGPAGYSPRRISTTATVHLDEGPKISMIELSTEAEIPDIDEKTFRRFAEDARKNCPVSRALAGVEVRLTAALVTEMEAVH